MTELEVEKSKSKLFTKKRIIVGVAILILLSIFYNIGNTSARVDLEGTKANYDELVSAIASKQDELNDTEKKIDEIEAQYQEKEDEFNSAKEVVANKDTAQKELDELTNQVTTKKEEVKTLDSHIKTSNDKLEKLENGIMKAEGEPKELMAGQYVVGNDVPEGRYQATNIGRGTNFFVYGSDGYAVVNTILGNDFGSGDYVFFATEGQVIETHGKVKLIPVK